MNIHGHWSKNDVDLYKNIAENAENQDCQRNDPYSWVEHSTLFIIEL